MTDTANIYTALVAAQSSFGTVTKGSVNPAFKSKYADLSDVANVVIPALSAHGVAVLHYMTGDLVGDGMTVMRTEFVHAASGTKVYCDVPLIVAKRDMQGMKSAATYAKRIGLESLSGVAPDDDDGNAASKAPPARQALKRDVPAPSPKPKTPEVDNQLRARIDAAQSAKEATDLIDDARNAGEDARRYLFSHATAQGFEFDKDAMEFVEGFHE